MAPVRAAAGAVAAAAAGVVMEEVVVAAAVTESLQHRDKGSSWSLFACWPMSRKA
jgi:hypothetical protein